MRAFTFDIQRFDDAGVELTADEKKNILDSSLPHLRMISDVARNQIFSAFISVLENAKDSVEFLDENVSPVYSLIGALYKRQFGDKGVLKLIEEAALFSSMVKIADSILDFCDNNTGGDIGVSAEELIEIANETLKMCRTLSMVHDENENGVVLALITANLSYCLSVLKTFDEDSLLTEQLVDIDKALIKLDGDTIKAVLKELGKGKNASAPFGAIDLGVAALVGILEGFSQMGIRKEYYNDDGLPEDIAHKEALLDALSSGLHETFHSYLKGADDVAFKAGQLLGEGCKWLAHAFSGDFSYEITISEMNYMEAAREVAKRAQYGSSSLADIIEIDSANVSLYAQDGDDRIYNIFPNVTILGGHGKDSISLYKGAKYNSILGGNGDDYLYAEDIGSTIDGGNDNDRFLITGNSNKLFGSAGKDIFIIHGGSNNIVTGGTGDDLIILKDASNSVIEYTQGDGQDVIYGYTTNTLFKIKGAYSTQVSGDDVIIQVGKGGIIVKDAKDLIVNTNTVELEEGETLPTEEGALIANPYDNAIILMPSFQGNKNVLRGTNGDDYIENTLDNIMIYGFAGDDTIYNYGKNVTINACDGADKVFNYATGVKINGGDGNDYIYNEAATVTANGGDGADTIENSGKNSRLDGGDGMDSIKNSGENTDINSGGGNDDIANFATNVRISGYFDDNYITNTKSNVTISGGDDSDTIVSSGSNVSINAGAGNNSVSIDGSAGGGNTIVAGTGDDTVRVGERDESAEKRYRNVISIAGGNNYINNNDVERSTIIAGSGNDTILTGGGYYNYSSHASIVAGAGDNRITVNSSMSYGRIYAGGGNDLVSIAGDGSSNIVSIGSGDDSVIAGGSNSTINVGAGKNYVTLNAGSSSNSVIAGSGNDYVSIKSSGGSNSASLGSGSNTLISETGRETATAGDGDDFITVKGGNLNVGGGKNNVSLTYGGNTTITAGDGDDTINVADKAEEMTDGRYYHNINAGDGNNYINNSNVEESTIIAGSGNDTIITGGGNYYSVSINAGAGDNRITVNSSMSSYGRIYAEGGNDFISVAGNGGSNIISVGSGEDSVITGGSGSTINVGAGKNFVTLNAGSSSNSVIAGSGNDYVTITSSGNSNSASLGSGNNTLISETGRETATAGDGDDFITVKGGNLNVGGGKNNVSLTYGGNTTIIAGDGDDTINVADKAEEATEARTRNNINAGDGNNYINNSNVERSTIVAGSGNDTILTGGDGYGYYTSIVAGAGDNRITVNSSMSHGKIYAEGGNDLVSVAGNGSYNIISVGDGRNTLYTSDYYDTNYNTNNTITAGTGSDLIYTSGNSMFVNAGSGRNSITLTGGQRNTLITGKGNDTINLAESTNNNVIIFGGGEDLVVNYHSGDTVKAIGALTQKTVGNDVILTDGTSTMTLKGAANKTVNTATLSSNDNVYKILVADKTVGDTIMPNSKIDTTPVDTTTLTVTNSTKSPVTIGAAVKTVDASTRTKAVKITGNDLANSIVGGKGADTLSGGTGNDTLKGNGGNDIFIYSAGKDVIADYASDDKISVGAAITKATLSGSDVVFTIGSGSLTVKETKGKTINLIDKSGKAFSTIISGATDTTPADTTTLTVTNSTKSPVTIGAAVKTVDASTRTKAVKIMGNDLNNTIIGGTKNDTLNGVAGDDKLTGGDGKDVFIYGGGNDTVTDYATGDKISIGSASIKSFGANGNDFVFNFEDGSLTLTDAASQKISVTSGKVTNVYSADGISNTAGTAVTLNASAKSFTADSKVVTINAGLTSGATVTGNSKANKIWLGDGSDVVIWSKGGNDTLMNFGADDLLSITGSVSDASITSGGNSVIKIGSNKITVKDSSQITFADDNGIKIFDNGIFYNADETSATIPASFKSSTKTPLELDAKEIDGSASKKALNISATGNTSILGSAKNDTIKGSASSDKIDGGKGNDKLYGGAGNDTLTGGAGNDSLWGNDGADKFIYDKGDGKDVIYGFDNTDMLEITDTFSTSTNTKGTEIYFKVGSTSKALTLKDFTATTFNVNGDTYQLSGKTLVKK